MLKCIFNHLGNHKKLDLLHYNKTLQYKFELTFDDYETISTRIKIVGINGYAKEYTKDTYNLIFEGNYSNGKKNGKGIEYFENGEKKLEGTFLNGQIYEGIRYDKDGKEIIKFKNGKGVELYDNNSIKFEGEYLNCKKWTGKGYNYHGKKLYEIKNGRGYISEYLTNGNLIFKGNYINGERNGEGKEYLNGRLLFKGNYLNGLRNGKGLEYYNELRKKFEGEYLNGVRWDGKVYDYYGNVNYEIKNGKGQKGSNNFEESLINIEEYNDDYSPFNSWIYVAYENELNEDHSLIKSFDFKSSILNHDIKMINSTKNKEDSTLKRKENKIKKQIREGKGKEYNKGELIFEGEYIKGKREGKGKEYYFDELIFEGDYIYGLRNGFGKEYYINKKIKFIGEYEEGKINGKGKEYDYFGRLIFEGNYVNNKRVKGIIYKYSNNDFSKYIYLIPPKIFLKYANKVPIDLRKEYYYKYHIKSSCLRYNKNKSKNFGNKRFIVDERKNKCKKNKKCKWSINNWR